MEDPGQRDAAPQAQSEMQRLVAKLVRAEVKRLTSQLPVPTFKPEKADAASLAQWLAPLLQQATLDGVRFGILPRDKLAAQAETGAEAAPGALADATAAAGTRPAPSRLRAS